MDDKDPFDNLELRSDRGMKSLVKRIMPHSLEAEQSVIGSMIMDRDAILTASEQLVKDDFYHQQYGILFETITELFNSGSPVDLITLQNRLREKNVPPEISSLEYVGDLSLPFRHLQISNTMRIL